MPEEIRPRIPVQLKAEVENIYSVVHQQAPESFQKALELTCTLAYEAIEHNLHKDLGEFDAIPGLPVEWRRLDDDILQIVDSELPETWKQSRLVAERVQKVIREFLQVRWTGPPLVFADSLGDGEGLSLRDAIKESFERARRENDQTVSLSAVRTTCHARLYPGKDSPATQFRKALTCIQEQAEAQGHNNVKSIDRDQ